MALADYAWHAIKDNIYNKIENSNIKVYIGMLISVYNYMVYFCSTTTIPRFYLIVHLDYSSI